MENLEAQIILQESRFNLIQQASEISLDYFAIPHSRQLISTRLEVLEQNWSKFQCEHESLCRNNLEKLKDRSYLKTKTFERCQEFYVNARATLMSQRDDIDASRPISASLDSTNQFISPMRHRTTLPKITIPQFSGEYRAWTSFRDLFQSMIGNNPVLSNVEKLHYLKTSLVGEAAQLISSLSISGENFAIAWETLIGRYENKRSLISAQLDKLSNLKSMKTCSARDLNSFMATVSESLGALRALDCPVQYWDILILHQLVKFLDSKTREAWESRWDQ